MKKYTCCFLLITFALRAFADVMPADWGAATNGLQISINVKNNQQTNIINQPLILSFHLRNVSANRTYRFILGYPMEDNRCFSCVVISPSGKDVSPPNEERKWPMAGSGVVVQLSPNQTEDKEFFVLNVSKLCKLDEVGTYKIFLKLTTASIEDSKPFVAVSNPLYVSIVPDK